MVSSKQIVNFTERYKKPPSTFGNLRKIRTDLAREQRKERKEVRMQNFAKNRKNISSSVTSQNDGRKKKLLEWQEERENKKKMEQLLKKPVFKVGIVRHRIYSPPVSPLIAYGKKQTVVKNSTTSVIKKKITKVTEKRLLAKAINASKQQEPSTSTKQLCCTDDKSEFSITYEPFALPSYNSSELPVEWSVGLSRIPIFGGITLEEDMLYEDGTSGKSINNLKTDIQNSLNNNSDSIETITLRVSSSDEKEILHFSQEEQINLREQPKLNSVDLEVSPILDSLNNNSDSIEEITLKVSSSDEKEILHFSQEEQMNLREQPKLNSVDLEVPLILISPNNLPVAVEKNEDYKHSIKKQHTIINNLNAEIEKDRYNVKDFKILLYKEKKRLQELCNKWIKIQSQNDITDNAWCQINEATGQTTLLIKEKLKQFRDLIMGYEENKNNLTITCADLQGFWDLIHIAVKDCDSRFEKLKRLYATHWQEEQAPFIKSSIKKKKTAKKEVIPIKQSLSRALILAEKKNNITKTRNNKKDIEQNVNINNECDTFSRNNKIISDTVEEDFDISRTTFFEDIYTSTPYHSDHKQNFMKSKIYNNSLITMKVNQLYNKMYLSVDHVTPKQTLLENKSQKLEISKKMSLRKKSVHKVEQLNKELDNSFFLTPNVKSFDSEKPEVSQNFGDLSEQVNDVDHNERIHIVKCLDFTDDDSISKLFQTVIETTLVPEKENDTSKNT